MRQKFSAELEKYLAFHRGIGEENTLTGIKNGIAEHASIQEFDVQRYPMFIGFYKRLRNFRNRPNELFSTHPTLVLGHPPHINGSQSLNSALQLFTDSPALPKVDLKPRRTQINHRKTLRMLIKAIGDYKNRVLVNIGGSPGVLPFMKPTPRTFMRLEEFVAANSPSNTLLNLDLARYGDTSDETVARHILTLRKLAGRDTIVHSFSPVVDDAEGIRRVTQLAHKFQIRHIHLWGFPDSSYTEKELISAAHKIEKSGLEPVVDIALDKIIKAD